MSEYKCCCDNFDPILSEEVEQFIEEKLDDDLVFLVAFGKNGKALPLRPKAVKSRKIDFTIDIIETTKITNAKCCSLTSYVGSDKCLWTFDGTHEEFEHPH